MLRRCEDAKMLIVNTLQATHILPPDSSSKVFDDACGIGTVTAEVKKSFPEVPVLAIDSSAGMLEVYNRKAKKHGFKNVESRLLDGGNLTGTPPPQCPACVYTQAQHTHFLRANKLYAQTKGSD